MACKPCVDLCNFQGKDKGLIQYPVTKAEMGTQTEIHPIETNLVKTYEWNEWELRRKAIKLVRFFLKGIFSLEIFVLGILDFFSKN